MQDEMLLRLPQVLAKTGFSRSRIYSLMEQGSFPQPVQLGARAVAWRQSQIADWIDHRPERTATPIPQIGAFRRDRKDGNPEAA